MKIKIITLMVMGLSTGAGAALAAELHLQMAAGSRLAAGAGTSVTVQSSGEVVADNGHERKTCAAGTIALATNGPTTISTADGKTATYPKGVATCLDPAAFGGKVAVSDDQGIQLKPVGMQGAQNGQ